MYNINIKVHNKISVFVELLVENRASVFLGYDYWTLLIPLYSQYCSFHFYNKTTGASTVIASIPESEMSITATDTLESGIEDPDVIGLLQEGATELCDDLGFIF